MLHVLVLREQGRRLIKVRRGVFVVIATRGPHRLLLWHWSWSTDHSLSFLPLLGTRSRAVPCILWYRFVRVRCVDWAALPLICDRPLLFISLPITPVAIIVGKAIRRIGVSERGRDRPVRVVPTHARTRTSTTSIVSEGLLTRRIAIWNSRTCIVSLTIGGAAGMGARCIVRRDRVVWAIRWRVSRR